MQYWDIVVRSFRIPWRHKYLWLLAFFSGEGGAGFSFSYSQPAPRGRNGNPDFATVQQQVADWVSNNIGLIVTLTALSILLVIALFVLAALCEGALVRGSAEHDAERPCGLGLAWRTGRTTMGTIIRFRLLLLALALPVVVAFLVIFAGFVFAILGRNVGALIGLAVVIFVVALAAIPYLIYLTFLDRLGTRAAVLEQVRAVAAIRRAHGLIFKRLGRIMLVWLISIAVGIGMGIAFLIAALTLAIPLFIGGLAAYSSGSAILWLVIVLAVLVALPIILLAEAFVVAVGSTYWTVAFRRLDIDPLPAYGSPSPYQPPQPATP